MKFWRLLPVMIFAGVLAAATANVEKARCGR